MEGSKVPVFVAFGFPERRVASRRWEEEEEEAAAQDVEPRDGLENSVWGERTTSNGTGAVLHTR